MNTAQAWSLLGLEPGSDAAHIRARYRVLARAIHPDMHAGDSAEHKDRATKAMAELTCAYELLTRCGAREPQPGKVRAPVRRRTWSQPAAAPTVTPSQGTYVHSGRAAQVRPGWLLAAIAVMMLVVVSVTLANIDLTTPSELSAGGGSNPGATTGPVTAAGANGLSQALPVPGGAAGKAGSTLDVPVNAAVAATPPTAVPVTAPASSVNTPAAPETSAKTPQPQQQWAPKPVPTVYPNPREARVPNRGMRLQPPAGDARMAPPRRIQPGGAQAVTPRTPLSGNRQPGTNR